MLIKRTDISEVAKSRSSFEKSISITICSLIFVVSCFLDYFIFLFLAWLLLFCYLQHILFIITLFKIYLMYKLLYSCWKRVDQGNKQDKPPEKIQYEWKNSSVSSMTHFHNFRKLLKISISVFLILTKYKNNAVFKNVSRV